jgi:CubicO group peptidase (beta-lactamase class C family)
METNLMSNYPECVKSAFLWASILLLADPSRGNALDLQPAIDPLAKQLLADDVAVGFVVGIYKDGEQQVIGYGETQKGKGIAPEGDTIYEIGSASKVFTGVLLADLVQRGRVKLDDPMQKYLPKAAKTQLSNASGITFEHLATHTSGLPRLPDNLQPADPMNPYADYTPRQMSTFLKDHQLRRAPGEYEYSNFGMGLLGVLLAGRARVPYEELLVKHIAKPCGMDDTCVKLSSEQRERLAPPYDAALQTTSNWDFRAFAGAGGIRSTTNDMLKFIAANLANDDGPLTKAFQLSHQKRHTMPDGQATGLAWHIARDGITRWHNGMTGGYASWVAVVPSHDLGVVVLSNTATMEITELGEKITRIAFGEKIESPAALPIVEVAPAVLEKYEGAYAITPQFALTVTLEGDKLMVQATGQQKFQVYPESETKFIYKVVDAQLTFVGEKNGKAELLILHQNGANQVATRQD